MADQASPSFTPAQQSSPKETSTTAETQKPLKFTLREQEVLALLVQGQANKEIASTLCICEKTVEFHLKNIYTKLGVTNRAQAIAKAIVLGIGKN